MGAITVAIVDDHEVVREGVERHLQGGVPEVEIVGSAATVGELPKGVVPDIVILDLVLREGTSLEDVPALVEGGSRVLLYTSEERPVPLRQAVDLGVSGVLLKGDPIATVGTGISMAMEGHFYVSGPLAHALITDDDLVADLSDQQRQVLQCINEGLDYRATARVMNISGNTVKEYLARIRDKYRDRGLHPGNSHHLTRLAHEEGHLG
jgi:DNA-binding NarL/FixJ family response regulator